MTLVHVLTLNDAGHTAQGYAENALYDARYALHAWPLFYVGAGNGE